MASFSEQMAGMAPWRRAVTVGLLIVAIVAFVLIVTGTLSGPAMVGVLVVVIGGSLLVGPRSPFFRSGPT